MSRPARRRAAGAARDERPARAGRRGAARPALPGSSAARSATRSSGRATDDLDVAVDGDVARRGARAGAGPRAGRSSSCPTRSGPGASWRPTGAWQVDLSPLRGGSLDADLALRDFTVNAIAEPLEGGARVDPHGGAADLAAGRLRAVGPRAFADDPLRVVRLVRLAAELGLDDRRRDASRWRARARQAPPTVAQERVFAELKRIVAGDGVIGSLALMDDLGLTAAILPELHALHGVEQNRYHHADVYAHTIEVLEQAIALQADPGAVLGAAAADGRARACSPSRWPRRSTAASGCAWARCCTTSPSR